LLDASSPAAVGLPLLIAGTVVACAAVLLGGRAVGRTKYRPDRWQAPEWVVVVAGVAALVGVLLAGRLQPGALHTTTYPLAFPTLPWPAVVGALLALLPAWVTAPQMPAAQVRAAPQVRDAAAAGASK
jgi:energy-coupling factor transport system permease protein